MGYYCSTIGNLVLKPKRLLTMDVPKHGPGSRFLGLSGLEVLMMLESTFQSAYTLYCSDPTVILWAAVYRFPVIHTHSHRGTGP